MPQSSTKQTGQSRSPSSVDGSDGEVSITLGLLEALDQNSQVSQRGLSLELGIALGLTNSYLRRCVRRGWVKVKSVPANRYAYYLTPKGFAEKSRLTASYLSRSLGFYREARNECDALLSNCSDMGWSRIGLYGAGELAEIALLCCMRHPIEIAGVVRLGYPEGKFLHVPVVTAIDDLGPVDGILLTEFVRPQFAYEGLASRMAPERILVPGILKVSRASGERG